jgi:hypothetical protein
VEVPHFRYFEGKRQIVYCDERSSPEPSTVFAQ